MVVDSIITATKNVDGWLSDKEVIFLYSAAGKNDKTGTILEIGSWKGKSTICLALGLKNSNSREKVHAVDWHKGSKEHGSVSTEKEFKKNVKNAGVSDFVTPIIMKSEDAAKVWSKKKAPIRLLWIDGSHEYEDVKKDFVLWNKYVIEGGVVAFHDTFFWSGPKRVVDEFLFRGNFRNIRFVDDVTYGEKTNRLTAKDRFCNLCFRFYRDIVFVRRFYGPRRIIERVKNIG